MTSDDVLMVSDVPFEYDYQGGAINYSDPSLAGTGNEFTYYYSIAPVDYQLPSGIDFEIIGQLHFTPEDEVGDNPTDTEKQVIDFYHDLNLEARHISDDVDVEEATEYKYYKDTEDASNPSIISMSYDEVIATGTPFKEVIIDFLDIDVFEKRQLWLPFGRVTVEDEKIAPLNSTVGVRNAEIRVRKWGWLPLRKTETQFDGRFVTGSTRTRRVKYAVYFHPNDDRFTVKAGTIFWGRTTSWNKQLQTTALVPAFSRRWPSPLLCIDSECSSRLYV